MNNAIKQLREIPGVGKSIAKDLIDLGYSKLSDLKDRSPEAMYDNLCKLRGKHIDRCVLYVFRCAVSNVKNLPVFMPVLPVLSVETLKPDWSPWMKKSASVVGPACLSVLMVR